MTGKPEVIAYGGVGRSSALFAKHHDPWTTGKSTQYGTARIGIVAG
jgi:hypothetical protein